MAHERKANESTSPVAKGQRSPIPAGKKDDLEDVSWALSTAEAMWGRGDHADGLKWLRRAAEAAAEAEADDRALELAKAAADVASLLSENRLAENRAAENRAAETRANEQRAHENRAHENRAPTPPPPIAAPMVTPSPIITTPSNPPPPPPFRQVGGAPSPQRVSPVASPYPRPGQKSPTPPRVAQPAPISKRGGRKSSPGFDDAAQGRSNRVSTPNEAKKRNRASKPSPDETAPVTTRVPSVTATAPFPALREGTPAWPTQPLANHDLDDDDEEQYTRIGTPAYTESAQKASARPPPIAAGAPPPIPAPKPQPPPPIPAAIKSSQAVRVVVWRAADGVHVAPAGTTVAAISVEAFLVATDPAADLTAWLTNK